MLQDLIRKLLVVNPEERLTMEGMLSHAWLKDAVATGRDTIAAKQQQRQVAKAARGQSSPSKAKGKDGKAKPAGHAEANVAIEGDGKQGGCCVIS